MHREEALWIKSVLDDFDSQAISPLLDIGSASLEFRKVLQPHIDEFVFAPLTERGVQVYHVDQKPVVGVDLVGDLMDASFIDELKAFGFKAVLCANVLEHVRAPDRLAGAIAEIVSNGLVIITVPCDYPKHLDPIDTMYRPRVDELMSLFAAGKKCQGRRLFVGRRITGMARRPWKLAWLLARCLLPFYRHDGWITAVHSLMWLFRERTISCVALRVVR